MKPTLFSWLAVLLLSVQQPARAALDFTLRHKALPADGLTLDKPYITDGDSKIFLALPRLWKVAGGGAELEFTPSTASSAVRLGRYQGSKLLTIDAAGAQELINQITSQLPADAKDPKVSAVVLNPLSIFGWSTLEVTFRYEYFGQTMRRSLMYISMLPGRVVQLSVVAADADFDQLHKESRQVLSSWFEPSRDLPPDLQLKYENAGGG